MFKKILIANRGEIACRVIESAKRMGVKTVAIFSDIDRNSKFVSMSDEAYYIGPNPASESYLMEDKILDICKQTGAEAVHPGYGFLSENAGFSEACASNGIKFIGPPAPAIVDMGSKSASKNIMIAAGVPVTPGYHGEDQSIETLKAEALKIGYPVMIKAVLGGGGKGMRICMTEGEFDEMLDGAKREAMKSFKDDRVLIERYLVKPRHVELQVFADEHGNCVYLNERDCSVQRRHQKVLEEAPAPGLSEEMRAKMGIAAVNAAKAVGYEGAGTVEFMLDDNGEDFFFMEMNTRLQVEHPVTEMVTGVDLVDWQLRIAAGHPLPMTQEEVPLIGHAIEARVYAENPENNFLPASGPVAFMDLPEHVSFKNGKIRIDSGIREGDEVSIFYDPMIAKLIVHGHDRGEALRVLDAALKEYRIVGLPTNIEFLRKTAGHQAFVDAELDTGFIEKHYDDLLPQAEPTPNRVLVLAALSRLLEESEVLSSNGSPWTSIAGAGGRFTGEAGRTRTLQFTGDGGAEDLAIDVTYLPTADGDEVRFGTEIDGEFVVVSGRLDGKAKITAVVGKERITATVVRHGDKFSVFCDQGDFKHLHTVALKPLDLGEDTGAKGKSTIITPMPGSVTKVMVKPGDVVGKGEALMIMTAMKMEHIIRAPDDVTIASVPYSEGDFVEDGKVLVSFVDDDQNDA
jgi:3-methylcrotonyl-CoA carboxylase alpha subunit